MGVARVAQATPARRVVGISAHRDQLPAGVRMVVGVGGRPQAPAAAGARWAARADARLVTAEHGTGEPPVVFSVVPPVRC